MTRRLHPLLLCIISSSILLSSNPLLGCANYETEIRWIERLDTSSSAYDVVAVADYWYVATHDGELLVYMAAGADTPELVATVKATGQLTRLVAAGDRIYAQGQAVDGAFIEIFDISLPSAPAPVGLLSTLRPETHFDATSDRLYMLDTIGLTIFDVSAPDTPVELGDMSLPGYPKAVAVRQNLACVVGFGETEVRLLDIGIPAAPIEVGMVEGTDGSNVAWLGDHILVIQPYGMVVVDASVPSLLEVVAYADFKADRPGVTVVDDLAYIVGEAIYSPIPEEPIEAPGGLWIFDLADPATPSVVATLMLPGLGVAVAGERLAVAAESDGIQIVGLDEMSQQPLLSSLDVGDDDAHSTDSIHVGYDFVNDLVLAVQGGQPSHYEPLPGSFEVLDLGDPAFPVVLGSVATHMGRPNRLAVAESTALVSWVLGNFSPSSGFEIIDFSDPSAPEIAGTWQASLAAGKMQWPDFVNGVALHDHYALVTQGFAGLSVIDIAEPGTLQLVGQLALPEGARVAVAGVHSQILAPLAFVLADGGFLVVDLTDPTAPEVIGSYVTPGSPWNMSVDKQRAYIADGPGGLHIVDITDPTAPEGIVSVAMPLEATEVWGLESYVGLPDHAVAPAGNSRDLSPQPHSIVYVAAGDIQVVDLSYHSGPKVIGTIGTRYPALDIEVIPGLVLGTAWGRYVQIAPVQCGFLTPVPEDLPRPALSLTVHPNPFNPRTTIKYEVPAAAGLVSLEIYDLRGQHLRTLVRGRLTTGTRTVTWAGDDAKGHQVAAGVYLCALRTARSLEIRKMALIR